MAKLDFITFIANTEKFTTEKKDKWIDVLAESFQYRDKIEDQASGIMIENPQSKLDFVNEKIINWLYARRDNVCEERIVKQAKKDYHEQKEKDLD